MFDIEATHEQPVFVTANGRPRRRGRWLGYAIATLTTMWIAGIFVGAAGFSRVPTLGAVTAGARDNQVATDRARYYGGPPKLALPGDGARTLAVYRGGIGNAWRADLRLRAHNHHV